MFSLKYPPFILFETPLMPVTVIFIMVVLLPNDALVIAIIAVVLTNWLTKSNECYCNYACEKRNYNLIKL